MYPSNCHFCWNYLIELNFTIVFYNLIYKAGVALGIVIDPNYTYLWIKGRMFKLYNLILALADFVFNVIVTVLFQLDLAILVFLDIVVIVEFNQTSNILLVQFLALKIANSICLNCLFDINNIWITINVNKRDLASFNNKVILIFIVILENISLLLMARMKMRKFMIEISIFPIHLFI